MVVTPNFGLRKPQYNEFADIEDLNANADILDNVIGTERTKLNNHISKKASKTEEGHVTIGNGLTVSDGVVNAYYHEDSTTPLSSNQSEYKVGTTINIVNTASTSQSQLDCSAAFYSAMGYTATNNLLYRFIVTTIKRSTIVHQEIKVIANSFSGLTGAEVATMHRQSSFSSPYNWTAWKVVINPISGEGEPNGSVSGMRGFLFLDIVTGDMYVKKTGINSGSNTGWEKIDASTLEELRDHENNSNIHVTTSEKTNWNGKVNKSGDTMTGNLNINKGIPTLSLTPSVNNPTENKRFEIFYNAAGDNDFGVTLTKDENIFMLVESANSVQFLDTDNQYFSVQDLKSSVSNGKNNLKTAILAKGGTVTDTTNPPSFDSLVSGVESISTGNYATGNTAVRTLQPLESFEYDVTGLNFTPTTIIVDSVGEVGVRNYFHTGTTYGTAVNISSPSPKAGGFTFIITNKRDTALQLTSTWQAFT